MAIRVCPVCGKEIPASSVVALTNGLECPHCHSRVEVSDGSRMLPTWIGLVAAYLVGRLSSNAGGPVGFALPELYAILTFGIVTPLALMLTAKLDVAPTPPATAEAHPAQHGHHQPAHH
jgi:DNA-directed RNA polymerase subunit RPC12/RpoP